MAVGTHPGQGPQPRGEVEILEMSADRTGGPGGARSGGWAAPAARSPFRFGRPAGAPAISAGSNVARFPLSGPLLPPRGDVAEAWAALPEVSPDPAALARARIVARDPDHPATAAFDLLRTRLMQAMEDHGWRRVAITSPTRGCGKTVVAANLALSLARRPSARCILVDLDLRRPGLAAALGVAAPASLPALLRARRAMAGHLLRVGPNLALGLNDEAAADAAELLQEPSTADILGAMTETLEPDAVVYDLPPALGRDDVTAFLPLVDGVLLVADATRTLPRDVTACEQAFEGRTQLFGVILNRADPGTLGRYAVDPD
ncbi:MAG: exopolysaccharide biosynthesis protein [Rhodobacteraceae bacterium]|jgi:Mrp family chromosome partitioning ATPase|nr:exopolysaccharide biosynthesis protein [Paracoccaceae bacterium]